MIDIRISFSVVVVAVCVVTAMHLLKEAHTLSKMIIVSIVEIIVGGLELSTITIKTEIKWY